jgi:hypothetical protein
MHDPSHGRERDHEGARLAADRRAREVPTEARGLVVERVHDDRANPHQLGGAHRSFERIEHGAAPKPGRMLWRDARI